MDKEEFNKRVEEIQEYYGKSLTEIVISLTGEPIYRHFTGVYYRVVGVGTNKTTDEPTVILKCLGAKENFIYTHELLDFLKPVSEEDADINHTGQKRCFEPVLDFGVQLDLVSTEALLEELQKRSGETLTVEKSRILSHDYVIARVLTDGEEKYIYSVENTFESEEDAYDNLKRNRRNKRYMSEDFKVLSRVFYEL